jgi:hypothetical protein
MKARPNQIVKLRQRALVMEESIPKGLPRRDFETRLDGR